MAGDPVSPDRISRFEKYNFLPYYFILSQYLWTTSAGFFSPLLLYSEPHPPSSPLTTVKWHSIPTICCRCAPTELSSSLEPPDLVQVVLHLIIMLLLTIPLLITMPLQVKVQVVLHPIIMLFHANQTPLNYQRVDQRQS